MTVNGENAEKLVNEKRAARYLSLTPRALQKWRMLGTGPRFIRLSRRAIRYRLADLETWLLERSYDNTSQPND